MILTQSQADAIRAAGGWVQQDLLSSDRRLAPVIAEIDGVLLVANPIGDYTVIIPRPPYNGVRILCTNLNEAVGRAIGEAERLSIEPYPAPPVDGPCNVIPFPRPTRLGAVESWLDGHADAAGAVVMKAMYRLADLARRADDILKERRNG